MSDRNARILDSVLDMVGSTPCIRLNRLPGRYGICCEVVAKCEFFNPGGSVKDRVAVQMVSDAEVSGRLRHTDTIVEASSGNTGIGIALVGAVKGYKTVITMPKKMSREKETFMLALGASVVRTQTALAWDHPDSLIGVANRLASEKGYVYLDQYKNPSNPDAHYKFTAQEIYEQCEGRVDMVVVGVGTGGTAAGVGKRLKELLPNVVVVAVDPEGSLLAHPEEPPRDPKPYLVEGIGYDFVPDVFAREYVDHWVKCRDQESFDLASQLHREEGLFVGGSSGSAMWGVLQAAKQLRPDQRCVVIFPDGIRNYASTFADENWMIEKGLKSGTAARPTYEALCDALREAKAKLLKYELGDDTELPPEPDSAQTTGN
ncbi:putative cystathionine beta-synthase [Trypanosoma vivax]|uniref:cystathionine beta-synthase n=1 Tax=Trypanosoma vivax (strain Y486) TaxID=1055687 RepID=G0UBX6_TRYVY|nr:putative cystathionine beta-synthase [Trypanosoma vivax]CCC53324.1 putative cystathionine beta-synthase [Trypanosoma vivax Y486]